MIEKLKLYIYSFDLIGISPQLLIFNEKRYKSKLSLIISIIIILFSIFFAIFSLNEYLKYNNPSIVYSKDNDEKTGRNILLKDFILMFQLVKIINNVNFNFIDIPAIYFKAYYIVVYNNGTLSTIPIPIENCKLGVNFGLEYEELVNHNSYGRNIEHFYCLDHNYQNYSLFYDTNIGFSYILIDTIMENDGEDIPDNLKSIIITENNIVDHYNKANPIRKSYIYKFSDSYTSRQFSKINYNFQYIDYVSDEGLLFKNSKKLKGMYFSDMTLYSYNIAQNSENAFRIGSIEFLFNKSNYDNYRRSYQKLQSLLAEVMSVISLLLEIGRQISYIFCGRKMSCNIIEKIFNKNGNKRYLLSHQNFSRNKLLSKELKNEISLSHRDKVKHKIYEKNSIDVLKNTDEIKQNKPKENGFNKIKESNKGINQIRFRVNYFHVLKSYLCCFKDDKSKLINICHNIINNDISIERILERIYNLEKIFYILSKKDKDKMKLKINHEFKEINEYIKKMNNNINKKTSFIDEKDKIDSNNCLN